MHKSNMGKMPQLPSLLHLFQVCVGLLAASPLITAEVPSLVVTIATDTVDPNDNRTSLREALAYANEKPGADTITFSNGGGGTVNFHDDQPETIILGGTELLSYTEMTIIGPGADKLTISGDNRSRIFQFGGNYSVKSVSGLSLENGRTSTSIGYDNGGGILLFGGELILDECVVSGNTAAWSGGGIYVTYGGQLTLVRTTISGNTAKSGGGVYTWSNDVSASVTLNLIQSTVSGNSATSYDGGGIHAFGGGVLRGNNFNIIQSTVSGNTAKRTAGGIFAGGALVNIGQSTVSGNTARGLEANGGPTITPIAGGVYASTCTLNLENSIVANSTGADFFQGAVTLNQKGKNIIKDASIPAGPNVLNSDPMLGPLQDNGGLTFTHALLPGSPAINAVDNAPVPADPFDIDGDLNTTESLPFDQRGTGFPRSNEILDIGAYELPKSVLISTEAASQAEGTGAGTTPFTFTVSRVVSTTGDVTMDYALTGVDVNGEDFGGNLPTGTVTIPDGSASTTLTIEVAKDATPETDETFTVTLANPDNGYVVLGESAAGTINDDDTAFITIAAVDANADENATGTGTWRISRTGSVDAATTVRLAIDASSTAMVADWTQTGASFSSVAPGSTGTVSIPAGATFVDIALIPSEDIHAEAAETVRLNVISDAAYAISGIASSIITISANDFVVINTNSTGEGTLRQAVLNSNNLTGAEEITFEGDVFTDATVPDIIDLDGMLPSFSGQANVIGPGADKLIIRRPAAAKSFGLMQLFSGSTVTLSGLTLSGGNGGIANLGNLRIDHCSISGNESSYYGGILNNGTLVVTNSTVSGNTSTGGVGGGIYNLGGRTLSVFNTTISGNSSKNGGGGISIVGRSTAFIANSTVSENRAGSSGAGILNSGALIVVNSTITGNSGTGHGGGIATTIGSRLTLANSIVAGNTASSVPDIGTFSPGNLIFSNGSNFIGSSTGVAGARPTDQTFASTGTTLSELLGPLAANGGPTLTHALVNGSPAINSGNNADIPSADSNTSEPTPHDQRGSGFARIIGDMVDIGAFEAFDFEPSLTDSITDEDIQSAAGLVITANISDDGLTTHFKISGILAGSLYQNDGTTAITEGGFITKAQGAAGLKFLPGANLNSLTTANFGFTVQASVMAANAGLRGVTRSASITVNPVNDDPTVVGDGLADRIMGVGESLSLPLSDHFADVDLDTLSYGVLSNSLPDKLTASVSGTSLDLASLASGVVDLTISASDNNGGTVSDTFSIAIGTVNPTPVQLTTTGRLNRQTGLFELTVDVTNTTARAINGFRLHVDYSAYLASHPHLRLYNASSPAGSLDVYLDHPYPLALEATVPVTLSFYTPTRLFPDPFHPVFQVEMLEASAVSDTNGKGIQPRMVHMAGGNVLLEFPSIPGRWYRVRYSSDLTNWFDCPVPIEASASRTQWIDSGAPLTPVPPSQAPSRFYRINEINDR